MGVQMDPIIEIKMRSIGLLVGAAATTVGSPYKFDKQTKKSLVTCLPGGQQSRSPQNFA
jgi:hypothetical protein